MTNVGSLAENSSGMFDFESSDGVMHLLASIRAGELSPEQKNQLRDLVFTYTSSGHDQTVRIALEQKVAAYGVQPLPRKVEKQSSYPFGTSRPAPTFSPSQHSVNPKHTQSGQSSVVVSDAGVHVNAQSPASQNQTPVDEPAPSADTPMKSRVAAQPGPEQDEVPVNIPTAGVPEEQTQPPAQGPSKAAGASTSKEEHPPTPPPAAADVLQTAAPAAKEADTVSVVDQTVPSAGKREAAPMNAQDYDPNKSLQRIREIKALVNERVGNPVNLVDIDNVVGREYMNALLEAMKKVSSGGSAHGAMQRLEAAYRAVESTLAERERAVTTPTDLTDDAVTTHTSHTSHGSEDAHPVQTDSATVSTKTHLVDHSDTPPASPTPAPPAPSPTSMSEPQPIPSPSEQYQAPSTAPETTPGSPVQSPAEPQNLTDTAPPPPPPAASRQKPVQAVPAGAPAAAPNHLVDSPIGSTWDTATDTYDVEQHTPTASAAPSLAQSGEKLRTPDELPDAAAIETSSQAGNPLYTKEIDQGLEQLLSEWSLFKKSGLFGTGPNGSNHPLYQKIKDLHIPLLLAGRFEGATQEIKQSITDYMNGWRYEQGIIYEQGESFDQYLRRVIRHILDLQKKDTGG